MRIYILLGLDFNLVSGIYL